MSQDAMTEGSGRFTEQAAELPLSARQRQAWRPPAWRTMESLLVGLAARTPPFLDRAASLAGWHERLSSRAQPWGGWPPLELPRSPDASPLGSPPRSAVQPAETARGLGGDHPSLPSYQPPGSSPGSRSLSASLAGDGSPARVQPMVAVGQSGQAQRAPSATLPARPRLRLAIQRVQAPLADRPRGGPGDVLPIPTLTADDRIVQRSSLTDLPGPRFGPTLSVSPTPRQEIRGGFPTRPLADGTQAAPVRAQFLAPTPSPARAEAGAMQQGVLQQAPTAARRATPAEPEPLSGDAIERLIEQTALPAPLPGFELRLVSPNEWPASEPQAATGPPPSPEDGRREGPLAPPTLDINALTDQVFQMLQRRQRFERERRGLY